MKIIIIEDEISSQQYLQQTILKHFPDFNIVAVIDNVPDAIQSILEQKPDLVFLDVEIKLGTGFDILSKIKDRTFEVVFTTAFNAFAVEAFRYSAIDYLLKPLNISHLIEATNRCIQRRKRDPSNNLINTLLSHLQEPLVQKTRLVIRTIEGMDFVEFEDIVYAEAKGNYTDIRLKNGTRITTAKKLKEIDESLPKQLFFRVHHSYIVNLHSVKKYIKGRSGHLVLTDGSSIPISLTRKDDFISWLG